MHPELLDSQLTRPRTQHLQRARMEMNSRAKQRLSLHSAVALARLPISARALTFAPRSRAFCALIDNTPAALFSRSRHVKRFAPKFSERIKRIYFRKLPVVEELRYLNFARSRPKRSYSRRCHGAAAPRGISTEQRRRYAYYFGSSSIFVSFSLSLV